MPRCRARAFAGITASSCLIFGFRIAGSVIDTGPLSADFLFEISHGLFSKLWALFGKKLYVRHLIFRGTKMGPFFLGTTHMFFGSLRPPYFENFSCS